MVLLILFNNFNVFVNTKNKNKNSFNIFLILIYFFKKTIYLIIKHKLNLAYEDSCALFTVSTESKIDIKTVCRFHRPNAAFHS